MVPVVFRAASEVEGVTPGVGIAAASTMGYFGFLVAPPIIGASRRSRRCRSRWGCSSS